MPSNLATLQFLAHGLNDCRVIGLAKNGTAGHKGVGAGGAALGGGGEIDAAVNFEAEFQAAGLAPVAELRELRQHVAAETLAAKLQKENVQFEFRVEKSALHAWQLFPDILPEAKRSIEKMAAFIASHS